jgi:hypothetical protein
VNSFLLRSLSGGSKGKDGCMKVVSRVLSILLVGSLGAKQDGVPPAVSGFD